VFSVLNVRSVAEPAVGSDITARARIRDAAVRCFGVDGFGAPVRAIAAAAGVSPSLVIHHFGSKDALRAACDEHVLRILREAKTEALVKAAPADMITQLATVDEYAPLVGYLMQALLTGGELATAFLDRLIDDADDYLRAAVEAGRVRPSRDPAARTRFLAHVGIGALLVHLRRHPPTDGDYRATLRAYLDANALPMLELYSEGLFTDTGTLDAYLEAGTPPAGTPPVGIPSPPRPPDPAA
jgi:AcrR family transcriptional regulator